MKTTKVNFVSDYSKSPSLLDDRCLVCKGSHSLTQCGQFKAMRPYQRLQPLMLWLSVEVTYAGFM